MESVGIKVGTGIKKLLSFVIRRFILILIKIDI